MKIGAINGGLSFGRALTTAEKKDYEKLQAEARKKLGTGRTVATIFDFSNPTAKNDTGIGSSFSSDAQKLADMLKTMCGVNGILLQPQGEISNYVRSPYSGTAFSLGDHIIDLNKLGTKEYGNLLLPQDYDCDYMHRTKDKEHVNYDSVFASDGQREMLKTAYERFADLPKTSKLKKDFEAFKKQNAFWLEGDSLFEAAAVKIGTRNTDEWPEEYQNVFATKKGDTAKIKELQTVEDEYGDNVIDYNNFVQFIADKQQKEAKSEYNKKGIAVYGDCQIGFSQKDMWTHKYAFYDTYMFGCDKDKKHDIYTCWTSAFDYDKLKGEAGQLLKDKFDVFFSRYDGVRIDAAWQLTHPYIVEPKKDENGYDVYDESNNRLGSAIKKPAVVPEDGKYIVNKIIMKSAKEHGIDPKNVIFELLGGNSAPAIPVARKSGGSLIHITRYAGNRWGNVKFYETKPDGKGGHEYMGMKPGEYMIGVGTHDDPSLIEQVTNGDNKEARAEVLANNLNLDSHELKHNPEALSAAVVAELFTTKDQFATLPDIMGSTRRLNEPNVSADKNWSYRVTSDFEKEYHKNLARGKGFNMPDALSKALKAKEGESDLTRKLDSYADILRQKGAYTTAEADKEQAKYSVLA